MLKNIINKYEEQIIRWDAIIKKRPFQQTQQIISRKIMLEEVVHELTEINEQQTTTEASKTADPKQLIIDGVMHRSIEFAKYASTYYKVCYKKEPVWLNRNNHKRFTSTEVYENFIKYTTNGA